MTADSETARLWAAAITQGIFSILSLFILFNLTRVIEILRAPGVWFRLRSYAKRHNRSVIVLTNGKGAWGSMLSMNDVLKLEKKMRTITGPVDLVVTTFGGEMIAGLRLARVLRRRRNVRIVVPKYAFSAGTLVSIAGDAILAHPDAMFGPVDPQFGGLFDGWQSAKDWQHASKVKGRAARDSTIAFAEVGRRLMTEMRGYVDEVSPERVDRERAYALLLDGDVSHARAIPPSTLAEAGYPVEVAFMDDANQIAEHAPNGVFAYNHSGASE